MTHKMAAGAPPPPTTSTSTSTEPHRPEEIQKDSNQEELRKSQAQKMEEFGYTVTNHR